MKREIIKILIFNLLLIFIIFLFFEIISYNILEEKFRSALFNFSKVTKNEEKLKYRFIKHADPKINKNYYRPVEFRSDEKPSIVILGCSFAYGFGLNDSQTLSKKLADYTGRTVYNYSVCANGISYIYWLFENNIISETVKNPEYIIYVYIDDHVYRTKYTNISPFSERINFRYKVKNGKLVEDKPLFLLFKSTFTAQLIHTNLDSIIPAKNIVPEIYMQTLSETVKKAKEQFPQSKFIILVYCDKDSFYLKKQLHEIMINKFKENSYNVITTEELTGKVFTEEKYYVADEIHPSEIAWDEVIPPLVKKLKLEKE